MEIMSPVCSAIGMNSSGSMKPLRGCSQRPSEVVLKFHTLQGPLIHARLEHAVIGSILLSLVHGRVCVPKQLICGLRAGVTHGDADAGTHKQLTPLDDEVSSEILYDPLSHPHYVFGAPYVLD